MQASCYVLPVEKIWWGWVTLDDDWNTVDTVPLLRARQVPEQRLEQ